MQVRCNDGPRHVLHPRDGLEPARLSDARRLTKDGPAFGRQVAGVLDLVPDLLEREHVVRDGAQVFDDQVAMQFVGVADQPLAGNRRETAEQLVLQRPARSVGDDGATVLDKSLLDSSVGFLSSSRSTITR